MTHSTPDHAERLAALLARTGMRRASDLPATPPPPRGGPSRVGAWRSAVHDLDGEGQASDLDDDLRPAWLPRAACPALEVVELRLDVQPDHSLAVVPVVRVQATTGTAAAVACTAGTSRGTAVTCGPGPRSPTIP